MFKWALLAAFTLRARAFGAPPTDTLTQLLRSNPGMQPRVDAVLAAVARFQATAGVSADAAERLTKQVNGALQRALRTSPEAYEPLARVNEALFEHSSAFRREWGRLIVELGLGPKRTLNLSALEALHHSVFSALQSVRSAVYGAAPASARQLSEQIDAAAVDAELLSQLTAIDMGITQTYDTSGAPKPHVVFLLADDLGRANVGIFAQASGSGSFEARDDYTPEINGLAAQGITLDRHYAYTSCTPSRAALLSGRLPVHIGINLGESDTWDGGYNTTWGYEGLPPNVTTLAAKLREAGYTSHMFGKFDGLGLATPEHLAVSRGFASAAGYFTHGNDYLDYSTPAAGAGPPNPICAAEPWEAEFAIDLYDNLSPAYWAVAERPRYEEEFFIERALRVIDEHDASTPLFLLYTSHLPHTPLQIGDDHFSSLALKMCEFNPACLTAEGLCPARQHVDGACPEGETCWWKTCGSVQTACDPSELPPNGGVCALEERVQLLAMVNYLDTYVVAPMITALKAKAGMWERTLFVFASDNGGGIGLSVGGNNFPLKGGKGSDWDGGFRSPALISGGFLPASVLGSSSRMVMHLCDWYTTFAHLAGLSAADPVDGVANVDGVDVWEGLVDNVPPPRELLHLSPKALMSKDPASGDWYKLVTYETGNTMWTDPDYPSTTCANPLLDFPVTCRPVNGAPIGPQPFPYDCGDLEQDQGCLYNLDLDPEERENLNLTETRVHATMIEQMKRLNEEYFEPWRGCENTDLYCDLATGFWGEASNANPTGFPFYGSLPHVGGGRG
mmetsp:Transcript_36902/g.81010  ORF Transcript_36902/g.81010 Transcript_36902/m.81010 type:complete len:790 (+) Transcript_36902:104-2473(+)